MVLRSMEQKTYRDTFRDSLELQNSGKYCQKLPGKDKNASFY